MIIDSPIVSGSYAGTGSFNQVGNVIVSGSLTVTGSILGNLTGTSSYATTSSYAITASYAANVPQTSSYAISASYAINATSASYAANSTSASYAAVATTSSYTLTSSISVEARNIVLPVKNVSGVQINKGAVVRISDATGDNAIISLADWTNDNQSANTLGLVTADIPNDSFGYVMTEGTFLGYDTSTPGWVAGQLLYLGASGSITGSAPQAPLHGVRLGQVLRVQQINGSIYLRIDNGIELGEAHDVRDTTTTSSFGDLLMKSGSVWINSKQLTGSYGVTGSINVVGGITATNTITAQTLVVQTVTSSTVYSSGSNIFGNDLTNSQILTGSVSVTGSLSVNGSNVILTNQTSSMSASYAVNSTSASFAANAANATSASYAASASNALAAQTASFVQNAQTASYVLNAVSASWSTFASQSSVSTRTSTISVSGISTNANYVFPLIQTGSGPSFGLNTGTTVGFTYNPSSSLFTINNLRATGSLLGTASFADNTTSASYAASASNSLFAQTASYWSGSIINAESASYALTASYSANVPVTSSYANNAASASYALTASYSANVPVTASYANNAATASYSLTSSYSLSGGGFPYSGSALITGSLLITNLSGSGVRYVVTDANGLMTAQTASAAIKYNQVFTASAGQTTFATANGYTTGYIDVFINGTKLTRGAEYTDTSGTNIVLTTGSFANDIVELVTYLPASGVSNNVLRQLTTFTASAGQTVFSASYVPGLLDIYYNGSHLSTGDYDASNGTYFTLATASAAGDILDVFVYSYQVGAFSGIGGSAAASQIAYFNTSNAITGSPNFNISGSTMTVTGSLTVSGSGTFTNIGPAVFSGSITSTAGFTGSFSGTATNATSASYAASATSASYAIVATTASYANNLTVAGTLTAQTLVVQTITSSVDFVTGSTRFGSLLSNTMQVTGSILISSGSYFNIGRGADYSYPLNVTSQFAKTDTTGRGLMFLGSNEAIASNPFGLVVTITGASTLASRMVTVGTTDYGLANGGILNVQGVYFTGSSVGIGSVNPATHATASGLVVAGTGGNRGIIEVWDNSATAGKAVFQNVGGITYVGSLSSGSGAGTLALLVGGNGSSATVAMSLLSNGNIGIGTTDTQTFRLAVDGPNVSQGDTTTTIRVFDTTSATTGTGGGISFAGYYSGTSSIINTFSYIKGGKENSTAGDYASYLSLGTRINGGSATERMRITSNGLVSINNTVASSNYKLGVSGAAYINGSNNKGVFITDNATYASIVGLNNAISAYNAIELRASGTDYQLYLSTNGNVGIRASNPRTMLQVTPVSNAETPVLGTATGAVTFTSANTNYGIQFNSTSDGSYFIQSQRFDSSATAYALGLNPVGGYVYLGKGWGASNHRINLEVAQGNNILVVSAYSGASNDSVIIKAASGANPNATTTVMEVTTNSSTGRSISAGGTINASGSDYAEYVEKAVTDAITKGDIVGINSDAKLTNIFADAISFAIKSTDPSYVGGDAWGNIVGKRPERTTDQTEEEFAPILAEFEARLEATRQKVDRIAFSGQVPCNVTGANVGDYIIPIELENGKIGGQAITNPTFEQYQISVGKVWKVMEDGRAWIAVKIG